MNDFEVLWRQNGNCTFCLAYWDFYQLNILELLEYPDSGFTELMSMGSPSKLRAIPYLLSN